MNISKLHYITFILVFIFLSGCGSKSVQPSPESEPAEVVNVTPEPVVEEPLAATPLTEDVAETETTAEVEPIPEIEPPQPPTDLSTVYFDFNSTDLTPEAKNAIAAHIQFLKDNPGYRVTLEGHTDARGSNNFNKSLGSQRATAIIENLIKSGISAEQISAISYGEEKPAVFGDNEEAWRSNRRAVFVYHQPESSQTADAQSQKTKDSGKMLVSDE